MKETATRLSEWLENACKVDKQTPLSEDVLHSSSVVDIFSAIFASLDFLDKIEISDPFFILNFAEVVCKAAKDFSRKLLENYVATTPKLTCSPPTATVRFTSHHTL
jgi:hypothetical protein